MQDNYIVTKILCFFYFLYSFKYLYIKQLYVAICKNVHGTIRSSRSREITLFANEGATKG